MKRRMHAALLSVLALVLGTGAVVLTGAGTAGAATGTVTLTPAGGSVTDAQPFTTVALSAACPAQYQDSLNVSVVMPGGAGDSSVVYGLTDGAPYTTAPITAQVPAVSTTTTFVNSISDAFTIIGTPMVNGTYPVHVLCGSADSTVDTDIRTFTTFIVITGQNWAVKEVAPPATTTTALTASPAGNAVVSHDVTLTAKVQPADATGTVQFFRDGGSLLGTATVSGGVATGKLPGVGNPLIVPLSASFVPDDATKFAPSTGSLTYPVVNEPLITALDDSSNSLTDNPTLTAGQKIKLTVAGFLPAAPGASGEKVDVTFDGAAGSLTAGTPDSAGTVNNYLFTVPSSVSDGSHKLTFKGHSSAISQSFAFTVGTTGTTSGTTTGTTSGTTAGTTSGTTSGTTAGTSAGTTGSGGTSGTSGGTSAGTSGGSTGTSGGSSSGGTSGGGTGPLAATGAGGVVSLSLLSLLLCTVGGYAVYRVRRDGKLLGFGPTPRD
jgi:hypothetical protein